MILLPIDLPTNCMDCPCGHYNPYLFSLTCAVSKTTMKQEDAMKGRPEWCQMEVKDGESN